VQLPEPVDGMPALPVHLRNVSFCMRHVNKMNKLTRRERRWVRRVDSQKRVVWVACRTHDGAGASAGELRLDVGPKAAEERKGSDTKEAAAGAAAAAAMAEEKVEVDEDKGFVRAIGEGGVLEWVPAREGYTIPDDAVSTSDLMGAAAMPFHRKVRWFRAKCAELAVPWEEGHVEVEVSRQNLLTDAFEAVRAMPAAELRKIFRFKFAGEDGLDSGGVAREFFHELSRQLFSVEAGLFLFSQTDHVSYQINPSSGLANELHLLYFRFAGRVFGKALLDGHVVPVHLTQPLYKHMLGEPVSIRDLEFVDKDLYNNLKWIATHSVDDLCLDFTVTTMEFGVPKTVDLKPNGAHIPVTDANKAEYAQLRLRHTMLDAVQQQLACLLQGLYEVIPQSLLSAFDFQELELLAAGLPQVDMEDWQAHTTYQGEFSESHQVVRWFWEVVGGEFSQEQKARLLQFATGTSGVPVEGFKGLQGSDGNVRLFCLQPVSPSNPYPRAHACFNRIDLPVYASKDDLRKYLSLVIEMQVVGFGLE